MVTNVRIVTSCHYSINVGTLVNSDNGIKLMGGGVLDCDTLRVWGCPIIAAELHDGASLQGVSVVKIGDANVGGKGAIGIMCLGDVSLGIDGQGEIENFAVGVYCSPSNEVSWAGTWNVSACDYGLVNYSQRIRVIDGSLAFMGGASGVGISMRVGDFDVEGGEVSVDGYDYGVEILGAVSSSLSGSLAVSNSDIHGVYLDGCNGVALNEGLVVRSCDQDGICVYNSINTMIEGVEVFGGFTGIDFQGGSHGSVRGSHTSKGSCGVAVGLNSIVNLGGVDPGIDSGGNHFYGMIYNLANFNAAFVVPAGGNCWGVGRACPPEAGSILGDAVTPCDLDSCE